jgi:hypothetical protein
MKVIYFRTSKLLVSTVCHISHGITPLQFLTGNGVATVLMVIITSSDLLGTLR